MSKNHGGAGMYLALGIAGFLLFFVFGDGPQLLVSAFTIPRPVAKESDAAKEWLKNKLDCKTASEILIVARRELDAGITGRLHGCLVRVVIGPTISSEYIVVDRKDVYGSNFGISGQPGQQVRIWRSSLVVGWEYYKRFQDLWVQAETGGRPELSIREQRAK